LEVNDTPPEFQMTQEAIAAVIGKDRTVVANTVRLLNLPEDMQSYWNDQYFHGVLPPPVLDSEEAVLRFVSSTAGAIGYVSACAVDKRVEIVALISGPDGAGPCPR